VRGDERGRKPLRRSGNDVLLGGLLTLEPRTRDQIGQGSSVWEAVELSTSYSSEFEAVEHHGRKDTGTQRCVTAFPFERVFEARTPGAAADLACPQGRRESKPSRG